MEPDSSDRAGDDPDRQGQPEHPTLSSILLGDVQQMDPQAWSRLVHTFGPIVYRWCRSSGITEADAPDLVQDVFASVARGIPSFQRQKDQGSFRSWLATITRNRVRDHFRRQSRRQQAEGGTEALERLYQQADCLDSTISTEAMVHPLVQRVLEDVRGEFENRTWTAFLKATVDGQPASQVAQQLEMSVAGVYQAKSRVLRRLRQRIAELPQ
jgi:RNA polymerase sigma-70 factor (ECF subfamily)